NFDPDCVDLRSYLAEATTYRDLACDQSLVGMEILRGTHEYSIRADWKLLVENSVDSYHGMSTHQRYMAMLTSVGKKFRGLGESYSRDLGNGHSVVVGAGGAF